MAARYRPVVLARYRLVVLAGVAHQGLAVRALRGAGRGRWWDSAAWAEAGLQGQAGAVGRKWSSEGPGRGRRALLVVSLNTRSVVFRGAGRGGQGRPRPLLQATVGGGGTGLRDRGAGSGVIAQWLVIRGRAGQSRLLQVVVGCHNRSVPTASTTCRAITVATGFRRPPQGPAAQIRHKATLLLLRVGWASAGATA